MTVIQEKLIDKIRKIIAHAEGTHSQAEADVFMAKANKLLLEHNLSMSQIETSEDKANSKVTQEKKAINFGEEKSEGNQWETLLMSVLCSHNMCDSIIHTKKSILGGSISIIGSIENIETVKYMFDVSRDIIRRLSKEAYKDYRQETLLHWDGEMTEKELLKTGQLPYRMPWIRNYLKGAVIGLGKRLSLIKEEIKREMMNSNSSNQFGLMLIDNKQAIEKFKKEEYEDLRKARSVTIVDQSAFNKGISDGQNINLNKGVTGSNNPIIHLNK